jgi:hypothetical protein
MLYPVYVCDDFKIVDGVLTIWNPKEVGKVKSSHDFWVLSNLIKYDSIVCPDLYLQDNVVGIVLFQ